MSFNALYEIPSETEYIFVSDFFASDLVGGCELTLEALYLACPGKTFKIRSQQLTTDLIKKGKDLKWILVNFTGVPKDMLVELATSGVSYSIVEADYKYCLYRSSHLHKLKTGNECDCNTTDVGRFIYGFFRRAKSVHFMSQGQLNEYFRLFPNMQAWPNGKLVVQGSTFLPETLDKLTGLFHATKQVTPVWAVLGGGSWIKNQVETETYCKKNKIAYELIGGLTPEEFLPVLSKFKGLVFHPMGFDTAPRLTIESKLLGLELDLNENVQHKNEKWFTGNREECLEHLKELPEKFWKDVLV